MASSTGMTESSNDDQRQRIKDLGLERVSDRAHRRLLAFRRPGWRGWPGHDDSDGAFLSFSSPVASLASSLLLAVYSSGHAATLRPCTLTGPHFMNTPDYRQWRQFTVVLCNQTTLIDPTTILTYKEPLFAACQSVMIMSNCGVRVGPSLCDTCHAISCRVKC